MMAQNDSIFSGCIPALMTPCSVDGSPDFDSLVATGKSLIDAGMRGVVYCGSMGDWPLLTDKQRKTGVARLVEAGIPVVVGTGAKNSVDAVDHATHAQEIGAAGLMGFPEFYREASRRPLNEITLQRSSKQLPACQR